MLILNTHVMCNFETAEYKYEKHLFIISHDNFIEFHKIMENLLLLFHICIFPKLSYRLVVRMLRYWPACCGINIQNTENIKKTLKKKH